MLVGVHGTQGGADPEVAGGIAGRGQHGNGVGADAEAIHHAGSHAKLLVSIVGELVAAQQHVVDTHIVVVISLAFYQLKGGCYVEVVHTVAGVPLAGVNRPYSHITGLHNGAGTVNGQAAHVGVLAVMAGPQIDGAGRKAIQEAVGQGQLILAAGGSHRAVDRRNGADLAGGSGVAHSRPVVVAGGAGVGHEDIDGVAAALGVGGAVHGEVAGHDAGATAAGAGTAAHSVGVLGALKGQAVCNAVSQVLQGSGIVHSPLAAGDGAVSIAGSLGECFHHAAAHFEDALGAAGIVHGERTDLRAAAHVEGAAVEADSIDLAGADSKGLAGNRNRAVDDRVVQGHIAQSSADVAHDAAAVDGEGNLCLQRQGPLKAVLAQVQHNGVTAHGCGHGGDGVILQLAGVIDHIDGDSPGLLCSVLKSLIQGCELLAADGGDVVLGYSDLAFTGDVSLCGNTAKGERIALADSDHVGVAQLTVLDGDVGIDSQNTGERKGLAVQVDGNVSADGAAQIFRGIRRLIMQLDVGGVLGCGIQVRIETVPDIALRGQLRGNLQLQRGGAFHDSLSAAQAQIRGAALLGHSRRLFCRQAQCQVAAGRLKAQCVSRAAHQAQAHGNQKKHG